MLEMFVGRFPTTVGGKRNAAQRSVDKFPHYGILQA